MGEKISVELVNVQITMLLPLWGRALETGKPHPLLVDNTAAEIIHKIDYDFKTRTKNLHQITLFEWVARCIHIDRVIKEFISKYPDATIVNIGCGLDTTFERVDNGRLLWYDLDLPDAIEFRKNFIKESERRNFISCSFFDESWFSFIGRSEHVLLIAAGVLYYFEENKLKDIFGKIAEFFPGCEIVFDAASVMGVHISNKKVIESTGLTEKSFLKWGINNASEIAGWNNNIDSVKEYPMFKGMKKSLRIKDKIAAFISDHYKIMYIVHVKFK